MSGAEWGSWGTGITILPRPYLGGHFLEEGFPDATSWDSPSLTVVRETHAGTHKVWIPFSEDKAPIGMAGVSLSIDAYRVSEEDYRVLESLCRAAAVTTYADGRQVTDRFPNATSGQSLRLTRPLALGTVAGITEEFFPTVKRLNGAVNAGAATISGQSVTVNTTGDLEVVYTPLYSVIIVGNRWSIGGYNDLQFDSFQMREVIQGSFS